VWSGDLYDDCCGRLHRGEADAATAEALMRSRFSAFAVGDAAYLARSWHPSTRPKNVRVQAGQEWIRLDVLATAKGNLLDAEGEVEFLAHYRQGGRSGALHELSRFVRQDGRWVYLGPVDAEIS
jgi:SEC-C motif-containing protein